MPSSDGSGTPGSLHAGWAAALEQRFALLYDPEHPDLEAIRTPEAALLLEALCDSLEAGHLRVVERAPGGRWHVNAWIRRALVVLSGAGSVEAQAGPLPGTEISSLGWTAERPLDRRIPAGSLLRRGAYVAPGASVMPPSTVQAGACLLAGTRVDSHVLIGSGAMLEADVSVGCGTMIGGVLQPPEALPVVLERGVLIGGTCGLYGSMVVGEGAQVYAGTVIRAAAGAFDGRSRQWMHPGVDGALRLPAGATVQMGLPPAEFFPDGVPRLTPVVA